MAPRPISPSFLPPASLIVARSFVKMTLGAPTGVDVDALKAENEQLRAKVAELQAQVESLASHTNEE
eukprot:scaffold17914_cov31-Tisochrysis_lutea.AAC.6